MDAKFSRHKLHSSFLLIMTIPSAITVTVLYSFWFYCNFPSLFKDRYTYLEANDHPLYNVFNPIISYAFLIAVCILPIIMVYLVLVKYKMKLKISKFLLWILTGCYTLLLSNLIYSWTHVGPNNNPLSAFEWWTW